MSPTACPRLFQSEAMRDGRLGEAERASFKRHMTACAACAGEVQALDGLARALRAATPDEGDADELQASRERTRLFSAFDRTLVTKEPRWSGPGRRWLWPTTVATLAVAGVLVFERGRLPVTVLPAARAVIRADGGAVWSKHRERKSEKVTLERGTLWIHVDHKVQEGRFGRFVVVLPDGELEDQGTTFTVSAENGHTKRVTVEEGRVVLRIRGQPSVAIGPGSTWRSETGATASAQPSPAPAVEPPPPRKLSLPRQGGSQGALQGSLQGSLQNPLDSPPAGAVGPSLPALTRPPARPARLPARPGSRPRSPMPVAPSPSVPDQVVDFRAAMAAFQAGDNVGAAAAFGGFVARYPQDPRAEDAAYLRVIALQRCGAKGDMRRAAEEYLRRYPQGFRHAEVGRLVR